GANNNVIDGNLIGMDVNGAAMGNAFDGILVQSNGNTIGDPANGNSISCNSFDGIALSGGASGNRIRANHIGTDPGGTLDRGNLGSGVHVNGSSNDTIGGTGAGEANVIARNHRYGVELGKGADLFAGATSGETVQGNS